MSLLTTRIIVLAILGSFAACTGTRRDPAHAGPALGESTAPGPSDSSAPPPDGGGVFEVSVGMRHSPGGQASETAPTPATGEELPPPDAGQPGAFSPPPPPDNAP